MKIRKYFLIAVILSVAFSVIYIYSQLLFVAENADIWLENTPRLNLALFVVFAALFGMTTSFQIYRWKQPKTCTTAKKSTSTSSIAVFSGFLVAQCPGCATIGALIIPSSIFLAIFVKFSAVINLINIAVLIFTIHYLGGFKKK